MVSVPIEKKTGKLVTLSSWLFGDPPDEFHHKYMTKNVCKSAAFFKIIKSWERADEEKERKIDAFSEDDQCINKNWKAPKLDAEKEEKEPYETFLNMCYKQLDNKARIEKRKQKWSTPMTKLIRDYVRQLEEKRAKKGDNRAKKGWMLEKETE